MTTGIQVLLQEIVHQLEVLSEAQENQVDNPEKGYITLQEQDEAYRRHLVELHSRLLAFANGATKTSFSLPAESLLWKVPAFTPAHLKSAFLDPDYIKERCMRIQAMRGAGDSSGNDVDAIWKDPELLAWAEAESPRVLLVQGSPATTHQSQRFAIEVFNYLETQHPTIFVLNGPSVGGGMKLDEQGLLRQLALQALKKLSTTSLPDQGSTVLVEIVHEFQQASTTEDWFSIIAHIVIHFPALSIIVDVDVLGRAAGDVSQDWPGAFDRLYTAVEESTLLRVILLSSRSFSLNSRASRVVKLSKTTRPPKTPAGSRQRGTVQRSLPLHIRKTTSSQSSYVPATSRSSPPASRQVSREGTGDLESHTPFLCSNQGAGGSASTTIAENLFSSSNPHKDVSSAPLPPTSRQDFKIAIICALTHPEADAVEALFDVHWDARAYGQADGDSNAYAMGSMSRHNVVLVYMPLIMGKTSAANVAANCRISFPGIKLALVVGICGGVPFAKDGAEMTEILLGDVVISDGIVLYDFGRQYPDGFERKTGMLDNASKLPVEIRSRLAMLRSRMGRKRLRERTVYHLGTYRDELRDWAVFPGVSEDKLFESTYQHMHQNELVCATCRLSDGGTAAVCELSRTQTCEALKCDLTKLVVRKRHAAMLAATSSGTPEPMVHFGLYASGDKVMKSGVERDMIAKKEGVVAFEMEGAGVWDTMPCLVIKGVCDYSDSHKNKRWQNYAAVTAASCAKAFLEELPTLGMSSRS